MLLNSLPRHLTVLVVGVDTKVLILLATVNQAVISEVVVAVVTVVEAAVVVAVAVEAAASSVLISPGVVRLICDSPRTREISLDQSPFRVVLLIANLATKFPFFISLLYTITFILLSFYLLDLDETYRV